jgi:O-antigen ligase
LTTFSEQISTRWLPLGMVGSAAILGILAGLSPKLALVAVCAVGFAAITLISLTAGTCMFATLWFFSEVLPSGGLPVTKLMGILLVIAWLPALINSERGQRKLFESSRFLYLLALFILWAGLSALWAEHSGAALTAVTRYIPNALLFPIVYAAIRKRDDARFLVAALVLGALLAAAYGVANPSFGEDPGRLSGALGNANATAASMVMALVLVGGLFAALRDSPWLRGLAALALPLCFIALLLTASRGGLIALAGALVVTIFVAGRWRKAMIAMIAVVLLGGVFYFAVLAPSGARDRVSQPGGGTGRVDIWTVGWRIVESHPINGVGAGNFITSTVHYLLQPGIINRDDFIVDNPKVAHNTYLSVLAELGIVGLVLFLAIVIWVLSFALKAARIFDRAGDPGMAALSRAVLVALIGVLVGAFFDTREYSSDLWMLMALAPALLGLARAQLAARSPATEVSFEGSSVVPAAAPLPA